MTPLIKTRLNNIQKICLCGFFIALTTILQKVVAINYVAIIPFLRLSLGGPALIIFSSIFLGPIYGLLTGLASDILGYFLLDMSSFAFFPQITAIYGLLGLLPYFVFYLFKKIKNDKLLFVLQIIFMSALFLFVSLFIIFVPSITLYSKTYTFDTTQKILIPLILFFLFAFLIVFISILNKKYHNQHFPVSINNITFSCFILELLVMVIFGSIMKGFAFGFQTYPAILITQIVVLFFNIPLNSVFIILFLKLTQRFYYQ
ncbi:MAG: ECF transporter S component [Bacilli bacterium]|nr:ECF transporter S component [Bacilli bacterium]